MTNALIHDFEKPGAAYRGKPFWAWNGPLEPDELRRQIRIMNRMGLGGFFMHSRVGLDTAYLSDDWFECVDACIDEAEKLDMEAWLYDEDRWPSGAAGGLVTKNHKYRMRSLVMEILKKPGELRWERGTVAAFVARIDAAEAFNVRRVARGKKAGKLGRGEVVLVFNIKVAGDSSWYNGQAYLDTLNPKAVAEFVRVTHGAYKKRVGKHFGKRIPGIFTDEPNYGRKIGGRIDKKQQRFALPWTDSLPKVFKKRYKYDLLPRLVELFFDVDGSQITPARYHYHDCVTQMFVDAFAKQIGKWCDRTGLQHTGHVLMEDTLTAQADVVGSCMRFYEYMQAPGMDLLTEHWRVYDTAKQVSSAARQFGRKWRLTETYGCTGWDFPFAGHKALGDWQVALGINNRCQHLSWYTMLGQAKRDYPAGIFYQSPWWEHYAKVEDYFARIHAVMTRGAEVRDLLVVHPVESQWVNIRLGWKQDPQVKELDNSIISLRAALHGANLDFDYGDEELLSRHAEVVRKKGQPVLVFGEAEYRAVVVPPMKTMRATTLTLLTEFRAAGGTVVFAGDVADHVDALPSEAAALFAADCVRTPPSGRSLVAAVEGTRRISIADAKGREVNPALYLLREDNQAMYLFVCNTGTRMEGPSQHDPLTRDRKLAFPKVTITGFDGCAGAPVELDPDTGAIYRCEAKRSCDGWAITTSLEEVGSRLFVVPKKKGIIKGSIRKQLKAGKATKLSGTWDISLSEDNALVLDRPALRLGKKPWQKPDEVLRVDYAIRDALKIKRRGGQMVQPWARDKSAVGKSKPIALKYTFEVNSVPSGACAIAVEQPRRYRVTLNGTPLDTDAVSGWWVDKSLERVPFDPALLRTGKNELEVACDYDAIHPGLEIVYILGSFGTSVDGTRVSIEDAPRKLKVGDWVTQGLSFFSGSVSYCRSTKVKLKKGERMFVRVPDYRGVAVRVVANGHDAGIIAWKPNEVDITEYARSGELDLRIEVLGHRRNSHGPLHMTNLWPEWSGPGEFMTSGKGWTDGYGLVPCGLTKTPELITRR